MIEDSIVGLLFFATKLMWVYLLLFTIVRQLESIGIKLINAYFANKKTFIDSMGAPEEFR